MSVEVPRVCLACCKPLGANRANEHIIADWLLAELGNTEEQLTQMMVNSITGEAAESRRPHAMDSFREGRICRDCNNGWMSTLENEAKVVLVPFINAKRPVTFASDSECLVVARWTLKTAVILSHALPQQQQKPLPSKHLRFLRENPSDLPPQVGVFGAITAPPADFSYIQRNYWDNVTDPPSLDLTFMQTAYKVGFEFKHLLLVAAYLPRVSSRFLLAAGLHVPLWPNSFLPSRRAVVEPLANPVQVLAAFCDSLGAVHRSEL